MTVTIILSGCATKNEMTNTTLEIKKDGTLEQSIVETFEKDYYDAIELQEMIESEISDFNLTDGSEKIQLNEVELKEDAAYPVLTYGDSTSYAEFNEVTFFYGTIAQAYEEGFDLDIMLTSAKDNEEIGKDDILQMGDHYLVIAEESIEIETFHNIEYISGNVTLNGKKEAMVTTQEGELAYIIFK